jgi:hypothetical protein
MFDLDDLDERDKVRLDLRQLNRTLESLRKQEAELRERREHLEAHIVKAQTFLTIMEMGWHYKNLPDNMVPGFARQNPPVEAKVVSIAGAKPVGLPTMVEMVRECIKEAGYPCRPAEVVAYIQAKWWPEVNRAYVNTTLWNLAKAGQLTHKDARYGFPGAVDKRLNGSATVRCVVEGEAP